MPEGALTLFIVTHVASLYVSQSVIDVNNREYLMPMDNITVLDHFFNLTKNIISLTDINTI